MDTNNTRRRFMVGSAGAVGGLALGGAFATGTLADEHGGNGNGSDEDVPPQGNATEGEFENDVEILNYALTLEHLEAEFYKEAFDNLGAGDIQNSETLREFDGPIKGRVIGDLAQIRDHEIAHVETLEAVITDLGGEPIEQPEFDFDGTTEDADAFLATAATLENTGVSAYAGAAPSIENADLVPPALSIHSVEARHASFLNVLHGRVGFPDAYDQPRSRAEVLDIASGFIVDEDGDADGDAQDDDPAGDEYDDDRDDGNYDGGDDRDAGADDRHGSKDKDDDYDDPDDDC